MGMSERIEAFILELLKQENEEWRKIQRNELAQVFGCVPSQINYVKATRFGPQSGYIVRSRRGGGGFVMIRRAEEHPVIDDAVSENEADAFIANMLNRRMITQREAVIIRAAVTGENVNNKTRAGILNKILRNVPLREEVL